MKSKKSAYVPNPNKTLKQWFKEGYVPVAGESPEFGVLKTSEGQVVPYYRFRPDQVRKLEKNESYKLPLQYLFLSETSWAKEKRVLKSNAKASGDCAYKWGRKKHHYTYCGLYAFEETEPKQYKRQPQATPVAA